MTYDSDSRASSPLSSVPSTSPSPPPELRSLVFSNGYPSPSSSKRSSAETSPVPENMSLTPASGDDSPPRKKRKLAEPKPRTTEYLDLRFGEVAASEQAQLDRLLKVLHKKKKIVVIAGAGISVSAGIPDFRSSTGLFKSLRSEHKLRSSGKDLFDASVYKDDSSTSTFHDMVRSLSEKTKAAQPTAFHHLLATLAHEGRLLRLYSQNVDGIDTSLPPLKTEIPLPKKGPWPKTVQLHGGLEKMVCTKCHILSEFDAGIFNGPVPPACATCEENDAVRQVAEKRSHGIGRLRPRMVLYNEHNPDDEAIGSVAGADLRARPDAVIVAGTTLKVPGIRRITREMCSVVRDKRDGTTIWINNDPEPSGRDFAGCWDLVVRGPCDEVARHAAMRHWDDTTEHKEVSAEAVRKISAENKAKVIVLSPKKTKFMHSTQEQLVTPAASPRITPLQPMKVVPKSEPNTPSKAGTKATGKPACAGRKRKSEVAKLDKTSVAKPPTKKPRAPARKTTTSKKAQAQEPKARITTKFQVAKAPPKSKAVKESKEIIAVKTIAPVNTKLAGIPGHGLPMAPISPLAARNNASCYDIPPRPTVSPLSSPVRPPARIIVKADPDLESRSSRRNSGTISPTGRLPNFSHVLIDTDPA